MARPRKWRKVCCMPLATEFHPVCEVNNDEQIVMTVDEYETIRLIDYQNFTQEECSRYMEIARTTVQQIYFEARRKLAQCIVEGKSLKISGGDYTLCQGKETYCGCGGCMRHRKMCMQNHEQTEDKYNDNSNSNR